MTSSSTPSADRSEIGTVALAVGFLGGPVAWALHLAVSYLLVTLDCNTGWDGGRTSIILATIVCAAAALAAGAVAWRGWKRIEGRIEPGELLDPIRMRGFLTLSGVLMAALFAGAIILAGMSPLLLPMCGNG
jgi:hypothetical protein